MGHGAFMILLQWLPHCGGLWSLLKQFSYSSICQTHMNVQMHLFMITTPSHHFEFV